MSDQDFTDRLQRALDRASTGAPAPKPTPPPSSAPPDDTFSVRLSGAMGMATGQPPTEENSTDEPARAQPQVTLAQPPHAINGAMVAGSLIQIPLRKQGSSKPAQIELISKVFRDGRIPVHFAEGQQDVVVTARLVPDLEPGTHPLQMEVLPGATLDPHAVETSIVVSPPGNALPTVQRVERLRSELFSHPHQRVYAVLDGAQNPNLPERLAASELDHCCLFAGQLDPGVAENAPYLVECPPNHPLGSDILENDWGSSWGIFLGVPFDHELRRVRKHLRTFLMVESHHGKRLFFRYYDPRVFSVYLQTANVAEANHVFGPVLWYAMESKDGLALLHYARDENGIARREVALSA